MRPDLVDISVRHKYVAYDVTEDGNILSVTEMDVSLRTPRFLPRHFSFSKRGTGQACPSEGGPNPTHLSSSDTAVALGHTLDPPVWGQSQRPPEAKGTFVPLPWGLHCNWSCSGKLGGIGSWMRQLI